MLADTPDTLVDQTAFLERLKASYILAVNEFTHNIPAIAGLPAVQRVRALRELHDEFAPTAIRFLSDLTHSTASVVRAETSLPAVKAQTTAKLASDLLTEVYHFAMEYLSKLHSQAADASAAEASHRGTSTRRDRRLILSWGMSLERVFTVMRSAGSLAMQPRGVFMERLMV
jgi:hypothetical protein